jgi:hypothetical protein
MGAVSRSIEIFVPLSHFGGQARLQDGALSQQKRRQADIRMHVLSMSAGHAAALENEPSSPDALVRPRALLPQGYFTFPLSSALP